MHEQFDRKYWQENFASPLSPTEFDKWQAQLTELGGAEADGTPRLQLFWGMDMRPEFNVWNRYRKEWEPPFISRRKVEHVANEQGILGPVVVFIGVPRFFVRMLDVSQVHSPNNAPGKETVKVTTADTDSKGNIYLEEFEETQANFTEARFRRRPYVTKLEWSAHDWAHEITGLRQCCYEHLSLGHSGKCYGEYLPPDQRMIERLRIEIYAIRHLTHDDPDAAYKLWLAVEMKKKTDIQQQIERSNKDFARRLKRMGNPFLDLGGH